jgi:NADPH:quinone reductase-like Zn-dependent oxidoreductase
MEILDNKNIPGFDIVGKVVIAGPDSPFSVGERVATISITGGNARYIVQPCSKLIRIDEAEIAHKICGILSAYVPAFALIQEGVDVPIFERYRKNLLAGKDVLVNGGMSNHGQAVIHLARLMGARNIYATGKEKDYRFLTDIGAVALPLNTKALMREYRETVDLVIDCTAFNMYDILDPLIRPGGSIVFNHYGDIAVSGKHGFRGKIDFLLLYAKSLLSPNCHVCNYLRIFHEDFGLFKVSNLFNNHGL